MQSIYMGNSTERIVFGGLGFYRYTGDVDAARAAAILGDNDRWLKRERLPAQVVCYQQANVQLHQDDVFAAAVSVRAGDHDAGGLVVPSALIVNGDSLPMWEAYCWLMAQAGVMRRAFTCAEAGRRWAAEQAALAVAQKRHRMRAPERR